MNASCEGQAVHQRDQAAADGLEPGGELQLAAALRDGRARAAGAAHGGAHVRGRRGSPGPVGAGAGPLAVPVVTSGHETHAQPLPLLAAGSFIVYTRLFYLNYEKAVCNILIPGFRLCSI